MSLARGGCRELEKDALRIQPSLVCSTLPLANPTPSLDLSVLISIMSLPGETSRDMGSVSWVYLNGMMLLFIFKNLRASLVAQWLRSRRNAGGMGSIPDQEDPTGLGATKPVSTTIETVL